MFSDIKPENFPSLQDQARALGGSAGLWDDEAETGIYYSNTSILNFNDQILVARRKNRCISGSVTKNWRDNKSKIELSQLDMRSMLLKNKIDISRIGPNSDHSIEDPRLHCSKAGLEIWCASWAISQGKTHVQQIVLKVDNNYNVIGEDLIPYGGNNGEFYEKNWCPIANTQLFVYSISPKHIVVDRSNMKSYITEGSSINSVGVMHGGTQAIDIGDYFLSICQSSVNINSTRIGQVNTGERLYFVWGYLFGKTPPYQIKTCTKTPLFSASYKNGIVEGSPAVLFPSGVLQVDSDIFVTLGVNDCKSGWFRVPLNAILALLQ